MRRDHLLETLLRQASVGNEDLRKTPVSQIGRHMTAPWAIKFDGAEYSGPAHEMIEHILDYWVDRLAAETSHEYAGHVDEGIRAASVYDHLLSSAMLAGREVRRLTLRTGARSTVDIHTEAELTDIVGALAEQRALVESARNVIRTKVEGLRDTALDTGATNGERVEAFATLCEYLMPLRYVWAHDVKEYNHGEDGQRHLLPAINAELKRQAALPAEPTDPDRLRAYYAERLEDEATGLVKNVLHAASQQGMDLPPSCLDQHTAMQGIAKAKQLAQIELDRATTNADLTSAYEAGLTAMRAVSVLNVPVFTVGGNAVTGSHDATGTSVVVQIRQPTMDPPIPGNIAASAGGGELGGALLNWNTVEGGYDLTISRPDGEDSVDAHISARNLCGPTRLELTLKAPAS